MALLAVLVAGWLAVAHASSAGEQAIPGPSAASASKATVVVNITHGAEDLHGVSMGIGLARDALKAGRRAILFLNVRGASLAAADLPADTRFADFPPVTEMLRGFIAEGGEIYVCAHCAAIAKLDASKILKGAVLTHHGELFKKLPTQAMTFSY